MGTISRWKLFVAALGALAVFVPTGVLAAAIPVTAAGGAPGTSPPTCSSQPDDSADTPTGGADAAPPATPPSGSGQTVTVEVPPGALYLEPNRVVVRVPAHGGPTQLAPVLIADLRGAMPGWQLTATVTEVRAGPDGSAVELRVGADRPEPVVGRHAGVRGIGSTRLAPGGCAVLAEATPGHGWGSYVATPTVDVTGAGRAGTDLELVLEYQLRTL